MENVSKALIMAASVLIGIVLLSMLIFIFKRFGDTARSTDKRLSQREIDSFNAKFEGYETSDSFGVTQVNSDSTTTTDYFSYFDLFRSEKYNSKSNYKKSLISASLRLNKVSDVVSAINDAIDINDRNNNSYKYNGLEVQSSVEVIIDLDDYYKKFNFNKINGNSYKYLIIEPNKDVKAKNVYGFNSLKNTKEERVDAFKVEDKDKNTIKVYNMLEELRDTKVITEKNKNKQYTVYKYYFFGEIAFNKITNLIETVKFTLIEDENFEE